MTESKIKELTNDNELGDRNYNYVKAMDTTKGESEYEERSVSNKKSTIEEA
jgi:hypothetical protein